MSEKATQNNWINVKQQTLKFWTPQKKEVSKMAQQYGHLSFRDKKHCQKDETDASGLLSGLHSGHSRSSLNYR